MGTVIGTLATSAMSATSSFSNLWVGETVRSLNRDDGYCRFFCFCAYGPTRCSVGDLIPASLYGALRDLRGICEGDRSELNGCPPPGHLVYLDLILLVLPPPWPLSKLLRSPPRSPPENCKAEERHQDATRSLESDTHLLSNQSTTFLGYGYRVCRLPEFGFGYIGSGTRVPDGGGLPEFGYIG